MNIARASEFIAGYAANALVTTESSIMRRAEEVRVIIAAKGTLRACPPQSSRRVQPVNRGK